MQVSALHAQIGQKGSDKAKITIQAVRDPSFLPMLLQGLGAQQPAIKYGCAKVLQMISERNPEILYPSLDLFIELIDSDNNILKWNAIIIIGNLAAADGDGKIDALLDRYLAPIAGPVMITAANVIGGAACIARAKPYLADRIARAFLKVEHAAYQTNECRNIALGHMIQAYDRFFEHIEKKEPVIRLIKKQLENTRSGTRKKAEKFLTKRK
jgi:hypothetical protein